MRKIQYESITIKNFLSVGSKEVTIDFKNGLNLITGKNLDNPERKNAVGKSVLIDAYYWVQFDKTIREIKKDFIVNNVTKGKGYVKLQFTATTPEGTKKYKIIRHVKPSKVELWEDDVDITRDSISNTNKSICEIVGSNPIISKSCDILSLSDNTPFMAKTAAEKRKFIEDIFALEIYGKMFKDLKELIKENKADVSIASTRLEEISKNLIALDKQKLDMEKQIEEKEQILQERKNNLLSKIETMDKEISSIVIPDVDILKGKSEKINEAVKQISETIQSYRDESTKLSVESFQAQKYAEELKIDDMEVCQLCRQDVSHSHKELIEAQRAQQIIIFNSCQFKMNALSSKITNESEKLTKLRNASIVIVTQIQEARRNSERLDNLKSLKEQTEESISHIEDDFKDGANSIRVITDSIESANKRKEEEDEILKELKIKEDDLDTCKFILGEEGIKSFAIKKLLSMLNSGIQKYITDLGMTMRCKFDEYFEEQITNDKGKDISYWNFSGGERRTVDLACAWAFKDLKRKISGVSSNVEFCDEIFDSAFDERGLDLLIEVLKSRIDKQNMSIYAISHRKETMKHIDGEIVMLHKKDGLTERVDSDD